MRTLGFRTAPLGASSGWDVGETSGVPCEDDELFRDRLTMAATDSVEELNTGPRKLDGGLRTPVS